MYPWLHLGPLSLPNYFLLISVGSIVGLAWFLRRATADDEGKAINIALVCLICGFLGARLFHVLYEAPMHYWRDPLAVAEIWNGGFVYYGGLLAGWISGVLYCRARGYSVGLWLDRASLPVALAYAIGRIGCFLNGCCYGRTCALPWAVLFPVHLTWGMAMVPRHPTQLYASGLEILVIAGLALLENRRFFRQPGQLFFIWLGLHAINRIIMEHWRDDDRGEVLYGLSVSTWISGLLVLMALTALARARRRVDNPGA